MGMLGWVVAVVGGRCRRHRRSERSRRDEDNEEVVASVLTLVRVELWLAVHSTCDYAAFEGIVGVFD